MCSGNKDSKDECVFVFVSRQFCLEVQRKMSCSGDSQGDETRKSEAGTVQNPN